MRTDFSKVLLCSFVCIFVCAVSQVQADDAARFLPVDKGTEIDLDDEDVLHTLPIDDEIRTQPAGSSVCGTDPDGRQYIYNKKGRKIYPDQKIVKFRIRKAVYKARLRAGVLVNRKKIKKNGRLLKKARAKKAEMTACLKDIEAQQSPTPEPTKPPVADSTPVPSPTTAILPVPSPTEDPFAQMLDFISGLNPDDYLFAGPSGSNNAAGTLGDPLHVNAISKGKLDGVKYLFLLPGNYPSISIAGKQFSPPLQIIGMSKDHVKVHRFVANGVKGIELSDIFFDLDCDKTHQYKVGVLSSVKHGISENVVIKDSVFETHSSPLSDTPENSARCDLLRVNGRNIEISSNEFNHMAYGVRFVGKDNLDISITDNQFTHFSHSAVRAYGTNIEISENIILKPDASDPSLQSPAIEAVYNSRIPAGDGFKVSGNIFFSLSRPAFVAKVGPLKNWEVSDNLFVTANEFAIYLRGLTDSNVEGNTVISPAPVVKGGISVIDYKADVPVVNTTAKDNSADKFDFDSGVSESNNSINSSSITDSLSAAGLSQELLDALAELISS